MRYRWCVLSLHDVQKCRLVTDWLSGGIKNEPLFCVLGSQVPENPKEAVRTSRFEKNLYKKKTPSVSWERGRREGVQKSLCANIER